MQNFYFILYCILLASCTQEKLLFTETTAYTQRGEADWRHEAGIWVAEIDSGSGFLMTETKYSDFNLTLDFMPDSTINSGVFVRCAGVVLSPTDCYELNIWDLHPNQNFRTGAVVTRVEPLNFVHTLNRWNTYRIVAKGTHLQAWINDVKVVDLIDSTRTEGYIGIQAAGKGGVKFRNLRIVPE